MKVARNKTFYIKQYLYSFINAGLNNVKNMLFNYLHFKQNTQNLIYNNIVSARKTAVGSNDKVIVQIQNLPTMDLGRKFRTPCKTGNKCGKVTNFLLSVLNLLNPLNLQIDQLILQFYINVLYKKLLLFVLKMHIDITP